MTKQTREVRLTEEQALTLIQKVGSTWHLVKKDILWRRLDVGKTNKTIIDIYVSRPKRKYWLLGNVENEVKISVPYENIHSTPEVLEIVAFNAHVSNPGLRRLYEKSYEEIISQERRELERNKRKRLDCLFEELK